MSKHSPHEKRVHDQEANVPAASETGGSPPAAAPGPADAASANAAADAKNEEAFALDFVAALKEEFGARIASLEAENSNLKDQYLRKAADFENFRKRMNAEKQAAIDYANQTLLLDLIPVIDDFERAIKSSEAARDYATLHEGIALIEKRLVSQLETKWGLVRFESAGSPFDPNRHEAIMMEKSVEGAEPTVSEEYIRGYSLKERIVRSAKVKVVMPADEVSAEGTE
ncbi:MAG: nucleotide exchange factor GrpE [Treponema sp. GWB1_62_6]|nr:MAG: nucleotide exchange factor GrpE [Treponema sp. GWB1_62_6]